MAEQGTQDDMGRLAGSIGKIDCYARGMSGPFGKFDFGEAKTHLDERTCIGWMRLCASKDRTSSELLRDVIYLLVHGKTPAEIASQDVRSLMNGEGPDAGPKHLGSRL